MSKQLKDYLHLYIGSQVKCVKGNQHLLRENSISANQILELTRPRLFTVSFYSDAFKLVLRPLSDMTREEAKQIIDFFGTSETVKGHTDDFNVRCLDHNPTFTLWLIQNGFDVFGLIEAGLALDKTKMNEQ